MKERVNGIVSVVIPHYGDRALTDACLAALDKNTDEEVELVLVDNGTGETFDVDIEIHNPRNQGFAVACNQGAKAATGDVVVFLNNDTVPHPGWLTPLVSALQDETVGAAGSLLRYPDYRVQHAGVRLAWEAGTLTAYNILEDGARRNVEAVTGACMAVDRSKFLSIGGFDEQYWNGYEDVDLCLTMRHMGWNVVYQPGSVVTHHESASGPERWTRARENVRRLQIKWATYEPQTIL